MTLSSTILTFEDDISKVVFDHESYPNIRHYYNNYNYCYYCQSLLLLLSLFLSLSLLFLLLLLLLVFLLLLLLLLLLSLLLSSYCNKMHILYLLQT